MKLLDRLRKTAPPEGAHGQRNIDGGYFTIWRCQRGHGSVGDPDRPPPGKTCSQCDWDRILNRRGEPEPTIWARATPAQARAFIFELEGFSMDNGIGFRMLV